MYIQHIGITRTLIAFSVLLFALFAFSTPAFADQDPPGCTGAGFAMFMDVFEADGVTPATSATEGDTLKYQTTIAWAGGANCNVSGGTLTITTPDGDTEDVTPGGGIPLISSGDPFVSDQVSYVATAADAAGGLLTATSDWVDGISHRATHQTLNGDAEISTPFITPLVIEKTAAGTFDRDWDWTIEKTVDEEELLLMDGETRTVNYTIDVEPTAEDTNHEVSGTITITNPEGNPDAIIDELADIADELDSGATMTVVCEGAAFPVTLTAGESLDCTYSGTADGSEDENTVTVTTSGTVPGGSDTATIEWDNTPANVSDECIVVDDSNPLGPQDVVICEDDADKTLEYSVTFGPDGGEGVDEAVACDDDFNYPNTATFVTQDDDNNTDETGSDDADVNVVVECVNGCTLTQGYWKTHSASGPAPADDTWLQLPSAENTTFFLSGATWLEVFNTPPKGNVYYNLAHQYMAAVLNSLNEADVPSDVQDALDDAEAHFSAFGPEATAGKGQNANKTLNAELNTLAGILGSYNEGGEGVPHCEE